MKFLIKYIYLEELEKQLPDYVKGNLFPNINYLHSKLYEYDIINKKWQVLKTIGKGPGKRYGHGMKLFKQ